jgi:hypothetical protein
MAVIWELDFYSRPVLDENQKRVWELLICNRDRSFEWTQKCPSAEVNSSWLANELEMAVKAAGLAPQKVRFFRASMGNIILRGCKQAGLDAQASRRVFTLETWLQERMQSIYPEMPGFQAADPQPLPLKIDVIKPQPLPDALIADQWLSVSLPASDFVSAAEWSMDFGEVFDIPKFAPDLAIPGLIMISARALPLAAWMSGVAPVFLKFENAVSDRTQLLLDAGAGDRWILTNLQSAKDRKAIAEGKIFETAKQKAKGLHFLAIQKDPAIEHFAGFWLLKEV